MGRQTLIIVDCSEEFRKALDRELNNDYTIHHCADGEEALEAATAIVPDVMVIDLMLTTLDGLSLMHELRNRQILPMVLATTRLLNDYVAESAVELGVGYIMLKPCNLKAVAARVRDLSRRLNPKTDLALEPQEIITRQLRRLGISQQHKGFGYLKEAVLMMAEHPGSAITKDLYPSVASRLHSTSAQVERSIRSAVKVAWSQNRDAWAPYSDGHADRPPSNGAIISKLSEGLRAKQQTE